MTGFGRARGTAGDWNVDVVVRSVNHRFFDLSLRVREEHAELEPAIRRVIAARVARGKIDVTLRLHRARDPAARDHDQRIAPSGPSRAVLRTFPADTRSAGGSRFAIC